MSIRGYLQIFLSGGNGVGVNMGVYKCLICEDVRETVTGKSVCECVFPCVSVSRLLLFFCNRIVDRHLN